MTTPECPVCATPYEAGASTCAFCGVTLAEPQAQPGTDTETVTGTDADAESSAGTDAAIEVDATAGIETEPEAATEVEPEAATETEAAAESEPNTEAMPESASDGETPAGEPAGTAGIPGDSAASAPPAPRTRIPGFARPRSTASIARQRTRRIEWGVAGGLAVLLLVQVVASDFDQLAASATMRPWLQRTCTLLHCTLPPWREPRALRLLQRDVSANAQQPGLLRIRASFRNDARWTQPWPRLRVTLSDTDGRMLATRAFAAGEYLGAGTTANGIASGQVAGIAFDVVDPSPNVTAFTFGFE